MNIFIIATICRESGALSIYNQLMSHLSIEEFSDYSIYVVVDPCMPQPKLNNVIYIEVSTIGLRRFWFDFFGFRRICRKMSVFPDVVFSLNNTVPRSMCKKTISYYHQALTLYSLNLSILEKRDRNLWIFSHFYYFYVYLTLIWTDFVIVQTPIIQNKFSNRFTFPMEKIYVAFPDVSVSNNSDFTFNNIFEKDTINFLYPATYFNYKEHIALIRSLKHVDAAIIERIRIHFTIKMGESITLENAINEAGMKKQFLFHGAIPYNQLLSMYKFSDGLLFPSTIETIGLPLLEAAAFGIPVITNEISYAKYVLKGYEGHIAVPLRDYQAWAQAIEGICSDKPRYHEYHRKKESDWNKVLHFVFKGKFE